MAQIVQQPDGLFAVYDGREGQIVCWNATRDEIVDFFRVAAQEDARRLIDNAVRRTCEDLDHIVAGNPRWAYAQFALTWDQVLQRDRDHGGEASRRFDLDGRHPVAHAFEPPTE